MTGLFETDHSILNNYLREDNAMINLLYQTYLIVLPIILGYIIWLLKEQKQKQINDAKARDERIQEEYKKEMLIAMEQKRY